MQGDRIIYIRPEGYAALTQQQRYEVASLIGRITNQPDAPATTVLIGPGRWGSRMPELGVPVALSQIRNVKVLCELATMHEGLTPELSLGTHFFNDLVDLDIAYIGVSPGQEGSSLNIPLLETLPNRFDELIVDRPEFSDVIRVADSTALNGACMYLWADMLEQQGAVYLADTCPTGGSDTGRAYR